MGKLAISLILLATRAFAASDDAAIQSTFVKPWVEALRSKDKSRVERFFHPAVRECITPATKDFFDNILDHETDSVPAGSYRIGKLAPMKGAPAAWLPDDGFRYPIEPAYDMDLRFDQSDVILGRFLAPSNGSWFEVYPCPNEKGMAYFHEQQKESAQQQKRTVELLAGLKDPLRNELKDLLRRKQKVDAVKKYRAATSADLTTAVMVMNALEKSGQ